MERRQRERLCPSGPRWAEELFWLFNELPWRSIFDLLFLATAAFIVAVGMLAVCQPLYDLTHWEITR
jgi:hypothetical protein